MHCANTSRNTGEQVLKIIIMGHTEKLLVIVGVERIAFIVIAVITS